MLVREPEQAGILYPADEDACRTEIENCLAEAPALPPLPRRIIGGIVPDAAWSCGGSLIAQVFSALAEQRSPEVIVLMARPAQAALENAALFDSGRWDTPIGNVSIDSRLAERILGQTNQIVADPFAHEGTQPIELIVPFVASFFPRCRIVPIVVPSNDCAHEVGQAIGRTLTAYSYDAVVLAVTALTRYGPRFRFTPEGVGPDANRWAHDVNDARFVRLACSMQPDKLVDEANVHRNADGAGAVSATVAAAKTLGAKAGLILGHTSSSRILESRTGSAQPNSVGYAGVVYG